MKKYLIILFVAFTVFAQAQSQKGKVVAITPANVEGAETIYFVTEPWSQNWNLTIQALCTEVGGTSDGTIRLEQSTDGISWEDFTDEAGLLKSYPNDTLTIVDGAVGKWIIQKTLDYQYRLAVTGTASDTTLIIAKYIWKDIK